MKHIKLFEEHLTDKLFELRSSVFEFEPKAFDNLNVETSKSYLRVE